MSHTVLAVGTAAVTAAGHVWYLPAVADLRAGDDRPRPTRLAAVATLTWWLGTAATGALLLTPVPWQLTAAPAVTGAASGSILRLAAAADRRAEQREVERIWSALRYAAPPGHPR